MVDVEWYLEYNRKSGHGKVSLVTFQHSSASLGLYYLIRAVTYNIKEKESLPVKLLALEFPLEF